MISSQRYSNHHHTQINNIHAYTARLLEYSNMTANDMLDGMSMQSSLWAYQANLFLGNDNNHDDKVSFGLDIAATKSDFVFFC